MEDDSATRIVWFNISHVAERLPSASYDNQRVLKIIVMLGVTIQLRPEKVLVLPADW